MNWFRFYHEALDDPKVQSLAPPMYKHWVNLLCLSSKSTPRGVIPCIHDVAFSLRVSESKAKAILNELVQHGLIDHVDGIYAPHNWEGRQRQSDTSNDRVRKHRERAANNNKPATGNNIVTLQQRNSNALETETEKEAEEETPQPPTGEPGGEERLTLDERWDTLFVEQFWPAYPRKVALDRARTAWKNIEHRSDDLFAEIMAALAEHKLSPQWTRDRTKIPHPTTWIHQRRWEPEFDDDGDDGDEQPYKESNPLADYENFHKLRRLKARTFNVYEIDEYTGEGGEERYQADLAKYTALVEGSKRGAA